VDDALAKRVSFAVGRKERKDDLAAAHEGKVRPHLAFVEDRVVLLVVALARGRRKLAHRLRPSVAKRGAVREEGRDVGLFVDPFDANRPASGSKVARVP
jgi:hypothetical protein